MDTEKWRQRIQIVKDHLTASSQDGQQPSGLVVSQEVQHALAQGRPVVALESTIISHGNPHPPAARVAGMPYPRNLETARAVEATVRAQGAVPATVAVLGGIPHVGLSNDQLQLIAREGPAHVRKTSRRDLPLVMARGLHGSTTVSATMLLAARAGIAVFVTGGIGGVHRGGQDSLDISADLTELGRTCMAVVCAGIKSVLDIPRTLEVLETQGVCVAAVGTDEFPAFFTPHSGCPAPCRVDTPAEAARLLHSSQQLGLSSGVLLGVPIPADEAAAGSQIEAAIQDALREASAQGISGHAVTPFLLHRIQELTAGASLRSNIALIKHNAAFGAHLAAEMCALRQRAA